MDLSALGSTLPPGLADAERDMGDKFRASALSITNLYKSSLSYTKQAYQVGYSACLSDVLSTVQSSIAGGQDATQTLSRLMDWAEARETAMAAFAAEETDDPTASNNAQAQAAAGNTATNAPVPLRRAALTKQALSHLQPPRPASAHLPEHRQHQSPDYASSPLVDKSNESRSKPMMSSTPASPDPAQQNQWQPTPTPHFASSSSSTPSASSSSVLPRQPFFNPNNASTAGSSSSRKVHHSPVRSTSTAHGVNVPQSTFNPAIPALPHAGMPFTTTTQHVSVGSKRALVDYEMADDSTPPATAARNAPSRAAKRRSMGTGVLSKSIEEGGDSDGNQRDRDRDRDRDGHRERRRGGKRNGGAGGVGAA